ncbi:uncharacterized protein LOC135341050 isoform X2 [Halichondria panicea]|uniref:uncharacterized protein LOC135341050 isoform X2 n=1 Tax=Halichondria panicea TaxID=6063 RepID=UPI00312B6E70
MRNHPYTFAKIVVTCLILLGTLLIKSGDGATDTLVSPTVPNGRLCFCPGDVETYTCTVVGGAVTVWSGTAFDCPSSNEIQLAHALYSGGTATGECGAIIGNGISVDTSAAEFCYTSELSVTISANMDGQTVGCTRDITLIGIDSLRVAGPPPPPTNMMVTEVGVSSFTITWVEPTSSCGISFSYDVVSDCGGSCSVSSSTSGVCSGWTAPQSCSIMVRANSDLCGGQTGSFSTPVMLNLMEPSPPPEGDVSLLAVYSDNSLNSITVTFPTVSPVEVAPGLVPAVTYSVRTIGDPQVVLKGNCNATLCQYQTEFTSDNRPSNDFTVTVTVSNGIGGDQSVNTPFQVPVNISSLVTLTVVVIDSNANVSARLSSGFQGSTGLTVTYGITPNCDANTMMTANGMAGDTLKVVLASLQPDLTYCYSIYFNQRVLSFKVVGVFRSECDAADLSSHSVLQSSEVCLLDGFAGGITIPSGRVCYTGTVLGAQHTAQSFCNQGYQLISTSSPSRVCQSDGTWSGTVALCEPIPFPSWVIAVCISDVVLSFAIGIVVGILLTHFCGIFVQGIRQRKCGTLLLVIFLIIVFGLGIGILIGYCCVKNKKETQKKKYKGSVKDENSKGRSDKLTGTEMSSPPPVVYKEILDPLAQENLAYSHVQQLQAPLEQRGPVYEDIKPDPHTQGNVAYGHVQFH